MKFVTVSVFLLTYNQEGYISETIESILSQETNFTYQLVIGEDCSTDETRFICEEYANQFPEKIKLLPSLGKNLGLIKNYLRTIKECDGKYIAICDGDDYWTDSYKLQKQVNFLIDNPSCKIVYTNYSHLFPDGSLKVCVLEHQNKFKGFEDLIKVNFIPSVTALFLNNQDNDNLPNWINKYPYGDWPTYLWTIKSNGFIGYINDDTAVYRMDIGTSFKILNKNSDLLKINIEILKDVKNDLSFCEKKELIKKSINTHKKDLMVSFLREDNFFDSFKVLLTLLFATGSAYSLIKLFVFAVSRKMVR